MAQTFMDFDGAFLATFVLASLAINLYPGPNNIFALSNAARGGVGPAMQASLGRHVAYAALIALLALGLGSLIVAMPAVFVTLKAAGAAFLVWLGVKILVRSASPADTPRSDGIAMAPGAAFSDELVVAFANPKPLLVLLPFLPGLVMPGQLLSPKVAVAGGLFLVLEAAAALIYAGAGFYFAAIAASERGRRWLDRAGGVAVIASAGLLIGAG